MGKHYKREWGKKGSYKKSKLAKSFKQARMEKKEELMGELRKLDLHLNVNNKRNLPPKRS